MRLGAENRNKTIAAGALGALALILVVYQVFNLAERAGPAAGSPPPAATATAPSTRPTTRRASAARTATPTKKTAAVFSLDPTLRLALLRSSEDTTYAGKGRNIFRAEAGPLPTPISSGAKNDTAKLPPTPATYAPPPINLKFFGFASKPGEPKRIFLVQDSDVFIAAEGDIVNRRYKVLHIGPASVEVEDVLNNNRQSIPLTQG